MPRDRAQSLRLFQAHNHVQLSRLTAFAPHPQTLFFQLLPLILHGNFKLLPGFVSEDCPAGIIDYQPDISSLRAASSVDRNFQFRRRTLRRYALRGVYLLNSFNGFSYPQNSQFTLWLVHNAHLPAEDRTALLAKLQAITDWAAQLGITLDSLMVSEADVRLHPEIQRDLTHFYANGLVLAGSLPLWWLIASDEQDDYHKIADRLLAQHQLSHYSLLDFGKVPSHTPQQLLSELLQCWSAAFEGDPRQDLALLFVAQQCQLFPKAADLSLLLKQAIDNDEQDSAVLSKASLQLTALQTLLSTEDMHRARQSLYLQSQERLSHKVLHPAYPWRRQFISALTDNWQWSAMELRGLDQPLTLGLRELLKQPAKRWQWLAEILTMAGQFAQSNLLSEDGIKIARKRLNLKQQPPADVIPQLDLSVFADNGLEQLNLNRQSEQSRWQLSDLPTGTAPKQALYADKALVNVLAFAIINGLLSRNSWLRINDPQPQLASHHILELSQLLRRSTLATPLPSPASEALNQPASATKIIMLANLQPAPLDHLQQLGLQLSSKLNDPLSFSSAQTNLIASVDVLLLSSWGQWHQLSFSGPDAVIEMLATLLRWQPSPDMINDLLCWCPTANFGQVISQRLQSLLFDILNFHQTTSANGRYLLRTGRQFWQIHWQDSLIETQRLSKITFPIEASTDSSIAIRVDPLLDK
ncbi:MAG: class I adenylate cyclase [Methylophaga sp.]|nr:class I adenylate cyclase [Methylophaga sp.]